MSQNKASFLSPLNFYTRCSSWHTPLLHLWPLPSPTAPPWVFYLVTSFVFFESSIRVISLELPSQTQSELVPLPAISDPIVTTTFCIFYRCSCPSAFLMSSYELLEDIGTMSYHRYVSTYLRPNLCFKIPVHCMDEGLKKRGSSQKLFMK